MFPRVTRVRSLFALCIIVVFTLLGAGLTSVFSGEVGQRAYDGSNLVRLRFVANSDSPEDQAVKRQVRDVVLEGSREWMTDAKSGQQMRELVEAHKGSMLEDARRAIEELGRSDRVRLTWGMFPYEADPQDPVRLPSGTYLTLQVIIGEGAGHNWWCLLFPTLCFGSEKGIKPVLPATGDASIQDDGAEAEPPGTAASLSDGRQNVGKRTGEDHPQTGRAIRWALAGFTAPVQASEGVAMREHPSAYGATGEEAGRGPGRFELEAGLYEDEETLDDVRFGLGLFK